MKIPETSANVGAYYGNEENGQWQPNGVIIDNGVGGGVVGSGDAGIHRPPVYPVHIPRGHVPAGYVMAGAYYPPAYPPVPAPQDDFADYMWMENEEEFDKQVMQQLEEEALMEQCIEAMLEDEQRERRNAHQPTTSNGGGSLSLEETVSRSTLNPLAAEFVPTRVRAPPAASEDKPETESTPATEEAQPQRTDEQRETQPDIDNKTEDTNDETNSEDSPPPPKEPPEVSAADVISNKNTSKVKKVEPKKPVKLEVKKNKPLTVKSDTKVQPKKKDVKVVKSEMKVEDDSPKLSAQVTPTEETSPTGLKPINYAAAAKASKPKQKSVTPPLETPKPSTTTKTDKPIDKKPLIKDKPLQKEKVQRKNSAK